MEPPKTSSPLIDVARSYISECCASTEQCQQDAAFEILKSFINGFLTYELAAQRINSLIHTTSPIDKIRTILTIDDNPLPAHENSSMARIDSISSTYGINSMTQKRKLNPWDPIEDARLLAAIHRYGVENWIAVAKFVGNSRTRAQCSQRWNRGLDPHLKKCRWTTEEEEKLKELVNLHGLKAWTQISQKLGNRSDVQCRYHYNQMLKANSVNNVKTSFPISNTFSNTESSPVTPLSSESSPIPEETSKPIPAIKLETDPAKNEIQNSLGFDADSYFNSLPENFFDFSNFEENIFL